MIRVFVLDDHEVVRRGLIELLQQPGDIEVVGQSGSAVEASRLIPALQPDVAVLDARLPDGNGIDVCRGIRSVDPRIQGLILTSYEDDEALFAAIMAGADAIAVDVTEEKLALARKLGAAHTINAAHADPVAAIQALGGADVAVVLAASPAVLEQAHATLRRGGRLVLVSLPKDDIMRLPVFETVLGGLTIIGSIVGTRADLAEVFALHAAGRTSVQYEIRDLDDINDAIEEVLASQVTARVVFRL